MLFNKIFNPIILEALPENAQNLEIESSAQKLIESDGTIHWDVLKNNVVHFVTTTGVRILIGLVLLFILIKLTNRLAKRIRKQMTKRGCDKTITSVTYQVISFGFKIVWLLLFLGFVGIQTASIGSIVASLGVAIGLAVQGSLGNFAGGLVILVTRPFKVGDYIKAQGQEGTVEDIRAFYTHLVTVDNKVILLPNGALSSGVIENVNAKPIRRLDQTWSIAYDSDYNKAVKVLTDLINKNELVLKDKDIFVRMQNHGESAVEIRTKIWVKTEDYWTVNYYMLEQVYASFNKAGIEIPYNKMDLYIKENHVETEEATHQVTKKVENSNKEAQL